MLLNILSLPKKKIMAIRVEIKKQFKNDLDGIIRLAISQNGTRKYKSLGISIPICKFSKSKQRVKSSYINANSLNKEIDDKIAEYSITPLTAYKNDSDEVIACLTSLNNNKPSSKSSIKSAIGYLDKYLDSKKQSLKISDLDYNIIIGFKDFMFDSGLGQNTVRMYMACIKLLINKAIQLNLVNYYRDPFIGIKVKKLPSKKVYIGIDEINKMRGYKGQYQLANDMFLFAFFCYGLRISECILMKWDNFQYRNNKIYLEYYQIKSKPLMVVEVNSSMIDILDKYLTLKSDSYLVKIIKEIEVVNKEIDNVKLRQSLNVNREVMPQKYNTQPIISTPKLTPQQVYNLDYSNGNLDIQLDNLILKVNKLRSKMTYYKITKMPKKHTIFRRNSDFDKYKTGSDLTTEQYNSKQRFTNYNNLHLKHICLDLGIQRVTTHSARHSFSRLMVLNGMGIDKIGSILGHTNVENTKLYVNELDNGSVSSDSNNLTF
jgi:integrase